jgi:putative ABC transport system ATP-binding protein
MKSKLCADMGGSGADQIGMGDPLIEMRDIVKVFKTGAGDFTALNGVDVCFFEGEFVCVVGKSGSGKSTLVNMLTGIDHPTRGTVRVSDTLIHQLSEGRMSIWRGRNLGIVFQFFQLLPMLSIMENIMLPMDFAKSIPFKEREARAMELLELVGLEDYAHELPAEVSGGQQQSAAIARALANDPPIIIADEPTGNLDSRSADAVFEVFTELAGQGKTIIMVTHDSSLARRTGRMLLLSDGELVNNRIATAFPSLDHSRLLWLTHSMQPYSFGGEQHIPLPDQTQAAMYLFTSGQVEFVTRNGFFGKRKIRLSPGEYLATPDLLSFSDEVLGLRSADGEPIEALVLDQAAFKSWMGEAPADQVSLATAAQMRVASWRSNGGSRAQEISE